MKHFRVCLDTSEGVPFFEIDADRWEVDSNGHLNIYAEFPGNPPHPLVSFAAYKWLWIWDQTPKFKLSGERGEGDS